MILPLNPSSIESYKQFLKIKKLPNYKIRGAFAEFPDEYTHYIIGRTSQPKSEAEYKPIDGLFDYQVDIARLAIQKKKFSIFADCGLGKTLIFLEYVRHVASILPDDKCVLIISPLMVIPQTLRECKTWYGQSLPIEHVDASYLPEWLKEGRSKIAITNYDGLKEDTPVGDIGCLVLDESSMLKSEYGKWGQTCLRLGRGAEYKLACTGTPAPNDRKEYGNHAVFMDAFPSLNSFLAKYFINRGQTQNRWEIKQHAVRPFYRALSHWCIFLTNPATYGWKNNCENIPPININIHDVPLTPEQQSLAFGKTGRLFADQVGGITSRSVLSQIAKGNRKGKPIPTNKPEYIKKLLDSWPDESTIIWCLYNEEQKLLEKTLPCAGSITGSTGIDERNRIIDAFKAGTIRTLISKPKILGYGLNLQRATRQIFSGLQDSYEQFYQAVKRSNRYGSEKPLNVHIPVTDIERPMIETVLEKAKRVQDDTEEQERVFNESRIA